MNPDLVKKIEPMDDSIRNSPLFIEIENQKNFYELLVNASSDGMLSVDMEGNITFINPAGMKILGIEKNVIGKHITEGVDFEPYYFACPKQGRDILTEIQIRK